MTAPRTPHRRPLALAFVIVAVLAACSGDASSTTTVPAPLVTTTTAPPKPAFSQWDWPTYGHDPQHTFAARTTLTATSVKGLKPAWTFPTGDAVTATPTVVDGAVYAGSWDGSFYALDLAT